MREIIVNTFVTVDGIMQAPGGPGEDEEGGFTHGGWSVPHWDEAMGAKMGEVMGRPFDLLLGRKTYEIFAAHWPHTDEPGAAELNSATKYVASRTLQAVEWQNSILLEGEVADAVARLKDGDGPEIQVHGSSDLLQTLIAHDLIDVYQIWTFPIVLGMGKRLFGDGAIPAGLRLRETTRFDTGVVLGVYERAGAVGYGSFALEDRA